MKTKTEILKEWHDLNCKECGYMCILMYLTVAEANEIINQGMGLA